MSNQSSIKITQLVRQLIKDPERKPLFKITYELVYLTFLYGTFPRHYFARYLFKKKVTNIKDYFPDKFLYYNIKPFFNNKEDREVLENKLFFDLYFRKFDVNLPKILMFNNFKLFVEGNNPSEVNSANDLRVLLEKIFLQNPDYDSLIVKKTYWSYGGYKIYKIYRTQTAENNKIINELYSEVIKSGFLFQATVKQHPELSRLNPSSLNTIRFDTFINPDGKIEIMSGYIRMSISNSHVDNISSGGCQVGIDLKTGILKNEGFSNIKTYGINGLNEHPVTKTTFENFLIPHFDEAKDLVIRSASLVPDLRLVGWDVAIGESGPVLIEGNSDYDISGNDLADGGYRANPVFRKVLKEIHYL